MPRRNPLNEVTYAVEHNPNCPSPFMVRLVGLCKGRIDHLPKSQTADILGYGLTFDEAAEAALKNLRIAKGETIIEPIICDGCNIREPFEHKCHGKNAIVRGEQTNRSCECQVCVMLALPLEEQEILACANYLGIEAETITKVETIQDGGGHFTGLDVIIHIRTERCIALWVAANLPKTRRQ